LKVMENLTPEKVDELIQGYLDMSLTHDQKIALEQHVEINSESRRKLEQYKKLLELMELQETVDVPEGFTQSVMGKLPEVDFSTATRGYGASTEKLLPTFKYVAMAVVAVMFVAFVNLDTPLFKSDNGVAPVTKDVTTAHIPSGSNVGGQESGVVPSGDVKITNSYAVANKIKLHVDGGVVHVKTQEGFKIVNSGDSYELNSFDEVRTGAKATASLYYPEDKIHLKLKPMSRVEVSLNQLRLFQGDSWVHVVKKGTRFEVKTSNLIAAVRGTVFSVRAVPLEGGLNVSDPKKMLSSVDVFEGQVDVRSVTSPGEEVSLEAGSSVSNRSLNLANKTKIAQLRYQEWGEENESTGLVESPEQTVKPSDQGVNVEINPSDSFNKDLR